jgi:pseudaminic acid synthase
MNVVTIYVLKVLMSSTVDIAGRLIDTKHPPFVIAEMSGNHNKSLDRAIELVKAAAAAGADALKLQTYTADTMTIDSEAAGFTVTDLDSAWHGRSLYDLYQEAHTPWEWHKPIIEQCQESGMIPISTPFDESAVEFLEGFEIPAYKVASFENTDIPLLQKIAATGKPMIVSTGMLSRPELSETVEEVRAAGCSQIILLKCTSSYPASPADANLVTIPDMRRLFNTEVGLSDHTPGIGVAVAAVALGATVIEKHFTLNRADGGVDSQFSIEPEEMRSLVIESQYAWAGLGQVQYGAGPAEANSRVFRRSLYFVEDICAGEIIESRHIRRIRPGYGLPPKHEGHVIGHIANMDIERGTPVSWESFS